MRRMFLVYGLAAYLMFFAVYAYLIGFLTNLVVPWSIDKSSTSNVWLSAGVNVLLLLTFGVQHSVMARPGFKRWWTTIVPAPIERTTYVMISNGLMILMFCCWMPMPMEVWHVQSQALRCTIWALCLAGFLLVPAASMLINHFDLFGIRQVWLYMQETPYTHLPFRTPLMYKLVRHPLYVGWLMSFWFTPTMSVGHLLFAGIMTAYILIAIQFEERDMSEVYGEEYEVWRSKTGMLIPKPMASAEPAMAS